MRVIGQYLCHIFVVPTSCFSLWSENWNQGRSFSRYGQNIQYLIGPCRSKTDQVLEVVAVLNNTSTVSAETGAVTETKFFLLNTMMDCWIAIIFPIIGMLSLFQMRQFFLCKIFGIFPSNFQISDFQVSVAAFVSNSTSTLKWTDDNVCWLISKQWDS